MHIHIEKACAGLRAMQKLTPHIPDYFIYCGPNELSSDIPQAVSGIPVIFSPVVPNQDSFNLVCELWYLPAYKDYRDETWFSSYKKAYEDYI